jgi:hypothetical protein
MSSLSSTFENVFSSFTVGAIILVFGSLIAAGIYLYKKII